jgi:site-specific DNA-methyltransferase (adenine-specific)
MQDFSKPWTDEELYVKYGLTVDEIAFIDSMIRPMNFDGVDDNGN